MKINLYEPNKCLACKNNEICIFYDAYKTFTRRIRSEISEFYSENMGGKLGRERNIRFELCTEAFCDHSLD